MNRTPLLHVAAAAVLATALAGLADEARGQLCTSNFDCLPTEYCQTPPGACGGPGVCAPRPEACFLVYDPVCGCDGVTYSNACFAAMAGANVASSEPCVGTCFTNADCLPTEYCEKPVGECNGGGVCAPRPQGCPEIFDPVCGCDGFTYSNACEAAAAGVNVAFDEPCDAICFSNADCQPTEYCARPVGQCFGPGVCQPKPDACPEIFDPVCGCDGVTYSNACEAAAAGVNVAYDAPCAAICFTNDDCLPTEYCAKPIGECNGPGVCTPRPLGCPDIWDPVCGCDGQTYGNACDAAAAGVSIASEGTCDNSCFSNVECGPDEYCQKPVGDCFGPGLCVARPDACPAIFDPVCGCDGQTYGNACVAALLGVSVAFEGPCPDECFADVNGDGTRNIDDVIAIILNWGVCPLPPPACFGDVNGDGTRDVDDVVAVVLNWGPCPGEAALCEATGGFWDVLSCGHYWCGFPPRCAAIIPGCDCGPGRNFVPGQGCVDDPDCP